MRQAAFTILTPVRPGHLDALLDLLRGIGDAVATNPTLALSDLGSLHYASFSVVTDRGVDSLLFEGNVDGAPGDVLRRLVDVSASGMDEIYGHCEGYPALAGGDPERTVGYLLGNDIGVRTFFVAWPERTVDSIRREQELRERILAILDGQERESLSAQDATAVRRHVVDLVAADPDLAWALSPEPASFALRHPRLLLATVAAPPAAGVLAMAGAAARHGRLRGPARAVVLAAAATATAAAVRLRLTERGDDAWEPVRPVPWDVTYAEWSEALSTVRHREDVKAQNHLASIVDVKPGPFRLQVLKAVLAVIATAAGLSPVKGALGGITSIHFARWALTRDGKRLVFLSNFDGSWESYLGDFIDLAARGLTAVWTNTDNAIGFPTTRWLLGEGARDEARFKAFARFGMVQTLLWWSAYPDLSVANIANNRAVRDGLRGDLDREGAEAWLQRL
jgi:hypothetical protein